MDKTIKLILCAAILTVAATTAGAQSGPGRDNYKFALRTNLLYDAMLYPTLGAEWRVNPCWGIKLDGSLSYWDKDNGDVNRMCSLNPEIRYYVGQLRRWYVGVAGTIGYAHINSGPMHKATDFLYGAKYGYRGDFYAGSVVLGYQVYLSPAFSLDLNAGIGYTSVVEYDVFTIAGGRRIHLGSGLNSDFFGLSQAGVSLVWKMGK